MTSPQDRNIPPQQAYDWLTSGEAILIDVREPDEFKAEHIAYALSLPLASVCDSFKQLQIPPTRKVIFQCLRGKRGEQACSIIHQNNDASCDIYNINGGIEEWKKAGLPVIGSGGTKFSIFRQVQMIVGTLVLLSTLLGFGGHYWGFTIAGILGAALAFAGLSGWCGLAFLLSQAPWNKKA